MKSTRLIVGLVWWASLGSSAVADAPLIDCVGSGCGGGGPTTYAYLVDSVSYPMMEFRVGTNDLDPANYANVLVPEGWQFAVEDQWMHHLHGICTPHGQDSPGPCWCLTAGSVRWWTDDPALAVEYFTFGYDHPWPCEDVAWELTTRREGPPPEYYVFTEDWDGLVGQGGGPVHGPFGPPAPCWSNDDCPADHYCLFQPCAIETGMCVPRPETCPFLWDPVCGCDGVTYPNDCVAALEGMSIAYMGSCLPGDFDLDADVDLHDYQVFAECMNGPDTGIPLPCAIADLDYDVDVDLADFRIFQVEFEPYGPPRIEDYANSGCLDPPGMGPCPEDDSIELTVDGSTVYVLHKNATYNCCLDDIVLSLELEGDVLHLTEEEVLTNPCYCICCYDFGATIVNLAPGEYVVEYCWYDYETDQEQCYVEAIVVPGGSGHVGDYWNSGCLGSRGDEPCVEDDAIEVTVGSGTLHVIHRNATYNCCLDDIVVSLAIQGTLLRLDEQEILTMPCDCMCCYNVEATVVDLASGEYTVEYCWQDWETGGERCHLEIVLIP